MTFETRAITQLGDNMARTATKQYTFTWAGKNREGIEMKGQSQGPNPTAVKANLRQQGINPTRVRKQTSLFGLGGRKRRKNKVSASDIAVFARQTATMMGAGVPLVQALGIIAKGNDNPALSALVADIRSHIEGGSTLAEALSHHPKHFDDLFINLVAAGEASGALDALLERIATYKEKTEAIKAKVRKAMFYPAAVITVAIAVMGILLYWVVPQFQALFQGFGADLPAFTRLVIQLSDIIQQWWWLILIAIAVAVLLYIHARRKNYKFRRFIDSMLLKLPIIGNIFYKSVVARFARTLSTMFAAGVPLVEALDSVAGASGNLPFEEGIRQMRVQVATGQQLQLAMANTGLFPNMAQQMVAIGEESGSLDSMCTKVADIYEQEVDNQVDALSSLLEPFIMVIIGVLVGGLVIAMYLPIFQLGSVV